MIVVPFHVYGVDGVVYSEGRVRASEISVPGAWRL